MTKILVVEDNPLNRLALTRNLERAGYEVLIAEDGERGRDLALSEQPDLIIMDVGLPRMNGLEVTRIVKSTERTAGIPIIVLTACTDTYAAAVLAGCDDYATKPIAFRDLEPMMQNLLGKRLLSTV